MHQQEVDVVDLQCREAGFQRAAKLAGVQVFVRHLGAQKYVRPGTPLGRMPSPTMSSVPYLRAVSMWR